MGEKRSIRINHFENIVLLDKLSNLVFNFKNTYVDRLRMKETERDVLCGLDKLLNERSNEVENTQKNVINFFNDSLFHFWKMIITYDTMSSPIKKEYFIYPYDVVQENGYVKCIYVENRPYSSLVFDSGLLLDEIVNENCTIELVEISKDDFLNSYRENVNNLVNSRLSKVMGINC